MSYDTTARNYLELHGEEQDRKARAIIAYLRQHALIQPHTRLLDIGCGPAASTALFPCDKTGIDPSKELLAQCADPSIKLVHGSAERLPFADDWFDLVISLTAVHNFADPEQGLREMKRVGNGLFAITVMKKSAKRDSITALLRKLFKVEAVLDDPTDEIYVLRA